MPDFVNSRRSSPLYSRAASELLRWRALSFRFVPRLESSETGRMKRTRHLLTIIENRTMAKQRKQCKKRS
jgi:hypothetical protein